MEEPCLLSAHGLVIAVIARAGPALTLRQIGDVVGLTERSAFRIVGELEAAGYLVSHRIGRRNIYEVRPEASLHHPLLADVTLADLLGSVFAKGVDGGPADLAAPDG